MFPFKIAPKDDDEKFMLEALKQAYKAFEAGEVPVGAVLVQDGAIIAKGFNQVELLNDATAHAEIICMTSAEASFGNWRLLNCTLYCTLEPCSMCAGAMFLSRLPRLVWGAPDLRHGANGSWTDLFALKHNIHNVEVKRGVFEAESATLMRDFFIKRRQEKDEDE
jgi:tRNA(adenine34) deaminase